MKHILAKLIHEKDHNKIIIFNIKNIKNFDFIIFSHNCRSFKFNYKTKSIEQLMVNHIDSDLYLLHKNNSRSLEMYYVFKDEIYEYNYENSNILKIKESYKNLFLLKENSWRSNEHCKHLLLNNETKEVLFFKKLGESNYYYNEKKEIFYLNEKLEIIKIFSFSREDKLLDFNNEKYKCSTFFGRKNCEIKYTCLEENKRFLILRFYKYELDKDYLLLIDKKEKLISCSQIKKKSKYYIYEFNREVNILSITDYNEIESINDFYFKEKNVPDLRRISFDKMGMQYNYHNYILIENREDEFDCISSKFFKEYLIREEFEDNLIYITIKKREYFDLDSENFKNKTLKLSYYSNYKNIELINKYKSHLNGFFYYKGILFYSLLDDTLVGIDTINKEKLFVSNYNIKLRGGSYLNYYEFDFKNKQTMYDLNNFVNITPEIAKIEEFKYKLLKKNGG